MSYESVAAILEQIVAPIFNQMALDLIELKVVRKGKILAIEILADKRTGGITIDECAAINRAVVNKIEEEEMIEDDYVVEVSSPGADRPLIVENDFLRVIEKNVRFHLKEKIEDKMELSGVIKGAERDKVFVMIREKLIVVPIELIQKAIQVI